MSHRLSKVDQLILQSGDHYYLDADDDCYFLGEYTARGGYNFGETNQLILNLKKSVDRVGRPESWYKTQAIATAGNLLRQFLANSDNNAALRLATLVPIPPSKQRQHELYDDRILRILRQLDLQDNLDIRELIVQTESLEFFHAANRLSPDALAEKYDVDEDLCTPQPNCIWIFDDVLTTGSHFKAAKQVLRQRFPDISIIGIFLARRVPGSSDLLA